MGGRGIEDVAFLAFFLPRPETEKVSPLPFSQSVHLSVQSCWHSCSPGVESGALGHHSDGVAPCPLTPSDACLPH